MVGIVSAPAGKTSPKSVGLVILVGGPQYRVGSHRQFVLLAWRLAGAGFPVLRFDYRGMGDSMGAPREFEAVQDDIAAAANALQRHCPAVTHIVLFGLCDAASAALMYVDPAARLPDRRIVGLCLLNPWVRSEGTLARTHLKHHYAGRLRQADFWRKLFGGGGFNWRQSARDLLDNLRITALSTLAAVGNPVAGRNNARPLPFQQQMANAFQSFQGEVLLILSGQDYTAKEFLDSAASGPHWRGALQRPGLRRLDLPAADHTFSTALWRAEVEQSVVTWMQHLHRPTLE